MSERVKTEIVLAGALLCFGVLALPVAIYLVGQQLVGEYRPNAGPLDLAGDIWSALGEGQPAAWVLVTSPYLVVQLVRLARRLVQNRRTVRQVTDPRAER